MRSDSPYRTKWQPVPIALLPIMEIRATYNLIRPTRYAFHTNFQVLNDFCQHASETWWTKPVGSTEHVANFLESTRHLQNFLAAAMMLKDHTNRIVRKVFDENELEQYQAEVQQRFTDSNLCGFIQDLRNYSLHRNLPFVGVEWRLDSNPGVLSTTIFLNSTVLKQWDNWSRRAKRFLGQVEDKLPLLDVCTQYYQLVRSFHCWLDGTFYLGYIYDLQLLYAEVKKAFSEIAPGDIAEIEFQRFCWGDSDPLTTLANQDVSQVQDDECGSQQVVETVSI